LLDAYGDVVSANSINGAVPSVVVSLDVLPIKTVKIDTTQALGAVTGIKDGYEAVNVTLSPEEVRIVGKEEVLSAVNAVQIKALSAGNANASVLLEGELESIVGVEFIDGASVDVYVQINEKQTSKVFGDIAISAKNLGAGLKATLSLSHTDVTVGGSLSAMAGVKRSGVTAYVDLSGLSAGTYVLPVKTGEISGIASSGVSVKDTTITVKIK
jgi:YbbR domain-containing protein